MLCLTAAWIQTPARGIKQFDHFLSKVNFLAKMELPCWKSGMTATLSMPQPRWMHHSIRHGMLHQTLGPLFRFFLSKKKKWQRKDRRWKILLSLFLFWEKKSKKWSQRLMQDFMADPMVHPAGLWHAHWCRHASFSVEPWEHGSWSNPAFDPPRPKPLHCHPAGSARANMVWRSFKDNTWSFQRPNQKACVVGGEIA